jgi:hypothetical protein
MKTLTIKDLALTEELDRKAMAGVHGGMYKGASSSWLPSLNVPKGDIKFNASQVLVQSQDTLVNNGNNAAFVSGITATVNPSQKGTNTINFG